MLDRSSSTRSIVGIPVSSLREALHRAKFKLEFEVSRGLAQAHRAARVTICRTLRRLPQGRRICSTVPGSTGLPRLGELRTDRANGDSAAPRTSDQATAAAKS